MALDVMEADAALQDGYLAPSCDATGAVRSVLFHPEGYSLWEVRAELSAGSELSWGPEHGDEVVFVLDGEVEIAGSRCEPRTAAIVESGVATKARAVTDTQILHFGPASLAAPADGVLGPPRAEGHGVHVVRRDDARSVSDDPERGARYYADSSCDTCRIAFFQPFLDAPHVTASHIHSEDEIIHVMAGEMQVGRLTLEPGASIAIPGGYRYGFRTPGPISFVNYRANASTFTGAPGSDPVVETVDSWRNARAAGRTPAAAQD
jgi:quercetin dioxygenase-like cupin family protein